jgi:hypothetical protein
MVHISLRAARGALVFLLTLGTGFAQPIPPPATMTGFSDFANRKDDRIQAIEVAAKLDVRVAGYYRLTLRLAARNGKFVSNEVTRSLATGPQTLNVPFNVQEIEQLGQDGPYRISGARLVLLGSNAVADSKDDAGPTQAYRLADLYHEIYYFTGDVNAAGINPTRDGKFANLRVSFGVVTPGGQCFWSGVLSDGRGQIDFENGPGSGKILQPGKSTLALDFEGFKIANRGVNGPLFVPVLVLECGVRGNAHVEDRTRHQTTAFHSSDFDNPEPDFELSDTNAGPIAPGDSSGVAVHIRTIGEVDYLKIEYVAEADNPKIHLTGAPDGRACSSAPSCWAGHGSGPRIETEKDLPAGTYTIRFTARAVGKEHEAQVKLVIDPEVENRRRQREEALAAVRSEDAVQPDTSAVPRAAGAVSPEVTFAIEAGLRKMHAMLVLDQSNSLNFGACGYMTAAAQRFSRLFVEGRDSIGVISFGGGVHLKLPLTNNFLPDAPQTISTIKCAGVTNTGEALEVAQAELARHEDPEAMNVVVLFTDGLPETLAAKLPVKPGQCLGPRGGELPALIEASFPIPSFHPPDPEEKDERDPDSGIKPGSCLAQENIYNFAYLPEWDMRGVSVVGNHPLTRFTSGPYAGRIRIDLRDNIVNAVANEVENAVQRLHTTPNPTLVYVIGFENRALRPLVPLEYLRSLANDPAGPGFAPKNPAGMAILTNDPQEFIPAFLKVREDLVRRAMLPRRPSRIVP